MSLEAKALEAFRQGLKGRSPLLCVFLNSRQNKTKQNKEEQNKRKKAPNLGGMKKQDAGSGSGWLTLELDLPQVTFPQGVVQSPRTEAETSLSRCGWRAASVPAW